MRRNSSFCLTIVTQPSSLLAVATCFGGHIKTAYLAAAAGICIVFELIRRNTKQAANVATLQITALAVSLWYCLLCGGVNADVAGVVAALAVPDRAAPANSAAESEQKDQVTGKPKPATLIDHLIFYLAPLSGLLIMPLFALANTAVAIDASLFGQLLQLPVATGIMAGLFLGKPLGIFGLSVAAVSFIIIIFCVHYIFHVFLSYKD